MKEISVHVNDEPDEELPVAIDYDCWCFNLSWAHARMLLSRNERRLGHMRNSD
jgi:hypothetical protein